MSLSTKAHSENDWVVSRSIADRAQARPGEPSPPSRRPLAVSGKKTGGDDELIY